MDICDESFNRYLSIYYERLFPFKEICAWLGYGDRTTFSHREFAFRLENQVIIRNLDFPIPSRLKVRTLGELPLGIDIGAIFGTSPSCKSLPKQFVERELIFDIDISDYDAVRTCCEGPNICKLCWKYIAIACKILNVYLTHDYGYNHILWIFSGRRGVHCWVCDKDARRLNQYVRSGILQCMNNSKVMRLTKGKSLREKKLDYYDRRLLAIVEPEFVPLCILDQDLLGEEEKVNYFLSLLPSKEIQADVQQLFNDYQNSIERWNAFVAYHKDMIRSNVQYWQGWEEFVDYIKLYYCFPRFDVNVTEGTVHLLRCPFSVHPGTGRIVIPFNLAEIEVFDISTTPTLEQLISEITALDKNLSIGKSTENVIDYRGTSLEKPLDIFKRFVQNLGQINQDYH